jgi:hypothetical protein
MFPTSRLEEMTDEVIGMEPLHDDNVEPSVLWSSRDSSVFEYHCFKESRALFECASCGLSGSSMIKRFPPRPVNVPPTEVASRDPRAVVITSVSVSFAGLIRTAGKIRR